MKFFANMVEAWFKQKFDKKIKVNINLTLMRIDIIKRRRNAMEKFLRSDIAELIRIGHYHDAYARAGKLYLDENRSLCYDFVALFCTLISDHLTTMNDHSECPEECKEAVSSCIYAAARFADLPELRKLRTLFSEKYGNSLESFVNKEFMSMLNPDRLPTKEMKIVLMQEIAREHSVDWDPRLLDDISYKPSLPNRVWSGNAGDDYQDRECPITDQENGWMVNIQDSVHEDTDDRKKDESNGDDIVKQTETLRQRLMDYWSRTTSLHSISRESSTISSGDSSNTSSDESTRPSRSFLSFRLRPPYVKRNLEQTRTNSNNVLDSLRDGGQKREDNKENEDVLNHQKDVVPQRVKNRWWRNGGGAVEEPKGGRRVAGHVHPKLPDYDEIVARFTALRTKS